MPPVASETASVEAIHLNRVRNDGRYDPSTDVDIICGDERVVWGQWKPS